MQNITNYKTKLVECDKCGWVGTIAKHIPLKQAWCGGCRSSRIRLHKARLTKRGTDSCPECNFIKGHHAIGCSRAVPKKWGSSR